MEVEGEVDPHERAQPPDKPSFAELQGKQIEVCWPYWVSTGAQTATGRQQRRRELIWSAGEVVRVAGEGDRASQRSNAKVLPAGAVLFRWKACADYEESDGQQWLVLQPNDWNEHKAYGWRLDVSAEVEAARARAKRPRRV